MLTLFALGLAQGFTAGLAQAVAPLAQDNASKQVISRSNPRSTQGGMGTGGQVATAAGSDKVVLTLQARCAARRSAIAQKMYGYDAAAQAYEQRLDANLAQLINIQRDLGLQSAEIASLVGTAQMLKRDEVRPAVEALTAVETDKMLDCSAGDVAANVRSFREMTVSTKDALNEYKQAIKALALTMKDIANTSVVR